MHCCQIEVPAKPFFNEQGQLLGYEPQPCPLELKVCCKGNINILGTCISKLDLLLLFKCSSIRLLFSISI